jgi:hypothetical protein
MIARYKGEGNRRNKHLIVEIPAPVSREEIIAIADF